MIRQRPERRHSRSENNDAYITIALSFVAGAASVGLIWHIQETRRRRRQLQLETLPTHMHSRILDDDNEESWIYPWYQSVEEIKDRISEDLKSRIGELPSTRTFKVRWPWDKMNRSSSASENDDVESMDAIETASLGDESMNSVTPKSGLCIGSIFGLDVGGTLAKLVYFEKKPDYCNEVEILHNREFRYQQAASAQAVLKARRGHVGGQAKHQRRRSRGDSFDDSNYSSASSALNHSGSIHSRKSNADLHELFMVRQESLPDDLQQFAASVHLPQTSFNSVRKIREVMLGESKDDSHVDDLLLSKSSIDRDEDTTNNDENNESRSSIRKSKSMFDLSKTREHAQALDRFYNFAKKLDSYREGVKDHKLSFYSRELGGEFHFIRFETRKMWNAMELIRSNNLHFNICEMGATGGGAHKYANDWDRVLGITMKKQEELDSLVAGMQFVLTTVVGECYTFRPQRSYTQQHRSFVHQSSSGSSSTQEEKKMGISIDSDSEVDEFPRGGGDEWWWSRKVQRDAISYSSTYPYLLVTIGTGVSILRVDGPRRHERISGSTIGGGTYWGLIRLLTDVEDFEDVMRLAEQGDPSKVDMMVGDIYGKNSDALEKIGLPSNLVASSFGKLVAKENPAEGLTQEDLARALLLMITINIGQVAYLNAKLHKTNRIYFVGNFLRQNKLSQRRLSFAIDYWSKGEMEALFLEHEGYFGALGAFLLSQDIHTASETEPELKKKKSSNSLKPSGSTNSIKSSKSSTSVLSSPSSPVRQSSRTSFKSHGQDEEPVTPTGYNKVNKKPESIKDGFSVMENAKLLHRSHTIGNIQGASTFM